MSFVLSTNGRDDILDLYKPEFPASIRLFKLPVSGQPTRNMIWSDFTEVNFSGYQRRDTEYGGAVLKGDAAISYSDAELFQYWSGPENDIYGMVGYGTTDDLIASIFTAAPRVMDECGNAIMFRLKTSLKDSGSGTLMFTNELLKDHMISKFHPRWCHLYKNAHTPLPEDYANDYTECDFPGYARDSTYTWCSPALDGNTAYTRSMPVSWTATGNSSPAQYAYGYYLKDASGIFIGAEEFASPIDMSSKDATIAMTIQLNLSNPVT